MKNILKIVTFFLFLSILCFGAKISGTTLPDTLSNGLLLNGAGVRSKFFFDLYVGGLYLKKKNSDALNIINANEPMAITLHITSSLISSKKMMNATMEGFENSTKGNIKPIKTQIDKFVSVFKEKIKDGDIYKIIYAPNIGVQIYKNSKLSTTIKGLKFKKVLFGIWLCEKPAQESLKKEMLGI
ncbi:MAG: chalcone isomerase family protein [Campylobacteraceae bacterium]|nr:chalcone isomerase family protein [Campylobacteraceae bacterium]